MPIEPRVVLLFLFCHTYVCYTQVTLIQYLLTYLLTYSLTYLLDIDDCADIVCLNSGACKDGLNSYTCQCQSGFTGQHCENGMYS